jgi:hypothetical protein
MSTRSPTTLVVLLLAGRLWLRLPGVSVHAWGPPPPRGSCARPTTRTGSYRTGNTARYGFFQDLLGPGFRKPAPAVPKKWDQVTIEPDFRVAGLFLLLGGVLDTVPYVQLTLGPLVTLLGILFFVQTCRLRFQFDEDNNFQLVTVNPFTGQLATDVGDNVIVGGANRWACDSFVNYDFFPSGWIDDDANPVGPILVYFKETQTSPEQWNQGPGQAANDPDKIDGGLAVPGQVHFFPAVANGQQLRAEFERRGCARFVPSAAANRDANEP